MKITSEKKVNRYFLLFLNFAAISLAIYSLRLNDFITVLQSRIQPRTPGIILNTLPLISAIFFLLTAILIKKQNKRVLAILNWLNDHKRLIAILILTGLIFAIYYMSTTVDLTNDIINHGMSGISLLFYGLTIIFLLFVSFSHKSKESRLLSAILLAITAFWLFMSLTKIGLEPDTAFWNVAGVPMMWISLATLLLFVLIINSIGNWITGKIKKEPNRTLVILLEVLLVFALWITASVLWINTPYSNSFFLSSPLPPDGHYWPNSDAKLMDLGGQYLIIGEKLETPYFTEKPFYALFLGLIHFIFGQSYQVLTNVQIMFMALIPVFLYFLGKKFSGRLFGLLLAAYSIIKEINAISSMLKISVSNSRLLMTELPSALLIIIFAYIMFEWINNKTQNKTFPLLAGLTIGVASYVRSNNLVVLVFMILFVFLIWFKQLKSKLPQISIFLIGILIAILPWTIYCQINYGKDPITWKIEAALTTRFDTSMEETPLEQDPNIGEIESSETEFEDENSTISIIDNEDLAIESGLTGNDEFYKSNFSKVIGHFLNNQVKSLFVLPFQLYPANLNIILDQEYWQEPVRWTGNMPIEQVFAFIANLLFISIGIATAWKQFKWAGLVPLVIQLSYFLSNALVRTSGSRYLIAVDWVVYFYFLFGIWTIMKQTKFLIGKVDVPARTQVEKPENQLPFLLSLLFCLIVGFSLPIINISFPESYSNAGKSEVFEQLPVDKIAKELNINKTVIEDFYNNPNSVFLSGREIYPTPKEMDNNSMQRVINFTLLTPDQYEINLPYRFEITEVLPAGEDMLVIGCKDPEGNENKQVLAYLVYFVQSDKLLSSTSDTLQNGCQ